MTVDPTGGTFISLAVDSNDRPHFAYNSLFLTGLHYAYWDGTTWTKQVIDATRTNHMTSIGLDAPEIRASATIRRKLPKATTHCF